MHLLPAEGLPYAVTAEALSAAALPAGVSGGFGGAAPPVPADRPARRALPSPAGMTWLAGDLHAHTEHSDGVMSVAELRQFRGDPGA